LRLLITGAGGLLGRKVAQLALEKGHDVYSLYREHPTSFGRQIQVDLMNQSEISEAITKLKPEAIIHSAACTDVDGCETNHELAWKINAEATKQIAIESTRINSQLIYVSTDYVFDGERGYYTEEDETNPLSYYGYTKLKGEEFTKEHATEWCIARPSVLYGWLDYKQNFATWLINSLNQKKEVRVLEDQFVSPTLNTNLAGMLLEITERKKLGILHTAGGTRVSRHEYALRLAEVFNLNKDLIKPAKMDEMSWKAKRPKDSSLNVNKTAALLNKKPLTLDQAFEIMKKERP
jgi:dTDP-4-dehydrorhamnose reductase